MMHPKDADRIGNSVDTYQAAPLEAILIWVYIVCPDLSARKCRIIMVLTKQYFIWTGTLQTCKKTSAYSN